jgi:hypothetical protein
VKIKNFFLKIIKNYSNAAWIWEIKLQEFEKKKKKIKLN